MICETVRIPYKYGETIKIKPIFDVHYGCTECDISEFKKYINEDDDSYFIGGGDWLDSIIVSDSKRYKKSSDASNTDDIIDEQVDGFYELIKHKKDRILCALTGNHESNISKRYGTSPIKRLCKLLNVPYLGYSGFLKLVLHEDGSRVRTVMFYLNHGFGGGRTLGADLTRYYQTMNCYEADCYLFGHTHQKHWTPVERIGVRGNKIIHDSKHLIVCGTFLRTLSNNTDSTYAEEKGYRPVSLGGVKISIKPNNIFADIWVDR